MDPRIVTVAAGAALLLGATPAAAPLAGRSALPGALDPDRVMLSLCGGAADRGAGLRARLQLAAAVAPAAARTAARLTSGLGEVGFPVTANAQARPWFEQGLAQAYGFNHAAAIASFRTAQVLDPRCAMCFWGEALALGPNINAPMAADAVPKALAATRRAVQLAPNASPVEQALIAALARRYATDEGPDRSALDHAYAEAMKAAAARFPADDDVQALAAEAVMDTQPWNYWEADKRTPKGDAGWAIAAVDRVLARNPSHIQAEHLQIHLLEASATPERAEAAADRLATPLAPASGHLVHMPAHIYLRLGRYRDSIRSNVAAAKADEAWFRASGEGGVYRYGYYPHNVHFIVYSAQMGGDRATVLDQTARLKRILDTGAAEKAAWIQSIHAAPYFAYAQLGTPAEILALPAPDPRLPYVNGMWRYARVVARAEQNDASGAQRELAALRRLRETADFSIMTAQGVPGPDLLRLAENVARGRLAYRQGAWDRAIGYYREAMKLEAAVPYMEPPYWYYPVSQSLGAALLKSGRAEEARQAFLQALAQAPNDGWALYGLEQAQLKLGDRSGAEATGGALKRAWLGDPKALRLDRL
jgi:tetratricopeptide (TPR) repeat protein